MTAMNAFESGTVYIDGNRSRKISDVPWTPHPKFSGVWTKAAFSGKEGSGVLSVMMVKIDPRHEIESHIHEGKAELHEILSGSGTAHVGDKEIYYTPGVVSLVSKDVLHSIRADDEGMTIVATFTPALQ
jgi:quercetin dioxygenase-like cupin family protein